MKRIDLTNKKKMYNLSAILITTSILFITPQNLFAADFQGNLSSVSISDADGSNQPPVATITYTKNGDTYTFDSSSSTDQDGTITEYNWTLGDGTNSAEQSFQYTSTGTEPITVSLTVVDDGGGVAIAQEEIVTQEIVELVNLIPNADDIQAASWSVNSVTTSSATTWTENGTYTSARLQSGSFTIVSGNTYTLTFDYMSATGAMKVQGDQMFPDPILSTAGSWTPESHTFTATGTTGFFRFLLEDNVVSTHTASIRNLLLVED